MINNAFLWWYQGAMKDLNIVGRTRLYKAYSWSNWQHRQNAPIDDLDPQIEAARSILDQSTISTWVDKYLQHFTLSQFQSIYNQVTPDHVDTLDIRVEFN
jgi:hypothetical protein